MSLLDDLDRRGAIDDVTDRVALEELLKTQQSIYIGFDPTADSLHVGSLLPALMLARFQRAGHKPVVLVGGATGMIGDPSGRTAERQLMTVETIDANVEGIRRQLEKFVDFSGPSAAITVNNYDWTHDRSYLWFLREIGKHFTVNHMLAKESVRSRLEDRDHGISYTEFSYMLLQAFDFLNLYENQSCRIQGGGSDQWGNITAGIELIRRKVAGQAFGITFPLLTTSSGEKFGKSAGNAVWLDEKRTSSHQFYQYWINTDDRDVERFLKLFTFLELDEIAELVAQPPERREAQIRLAYEVTALVHGPEKAAKAKESAILLFLGDPLQLSDEVRLKLENVPQFDVDGTAIDRGVRITDLLVSSGAVKSKGEAARLIQGGGVYLDDVRITLVNATLSRESLGENKTFLLRVGKKSNYIGKINT